MLIFLTTFLLALTGCQNGKKFESSESMISELIGTYAASDEHIGEYIIINDENIIKFNIDNIFPQINDEQFFKGNFHEENWNTFDLNALLSKQYVKVVTEPISTDVKNSSLSGLWIDKNGVLYSQKKKGYPLKKVLSECHYPTDEMKEKFEEYSKYLQDYERSLIIKEAENDFSDKQKSLDAVLSSATNVTSSKMESTASAKTIAECAFDSLHKVLKYPRTAELLKYSSEPLKDSYGRVLTGIVVKYQNGLGNYITNDIWVVLQSCSSSGKYTYKSGNHYVIQKSNYDDKLTQAVLMTANDWDKDPNYDTTKETPYLEAIQIAKDGNYESAIKKLETLNDYKKSESLINACKNYMYAEKYKKAVNLFAEEKYSEASVELSALMNNTDSAYWSDKATRVIFLCNIRNNTLPKDDVLPPKENIPNSENENNAENSSNTSSNSNTDNNNNFNHNNSNTNSSKNENNGSTSNSSNNGDNTTTSPCANGHKWIDATCSSPATCSVCRKTSGQPLGHDLYITKCTRCDYTDFSRLAKSYSDGAVTAYDSKTGEDYTVTNVKLSNSGIFSFHFNGKQYSLSVVQTNKKEGTSDLVVFDCYLDGKREPDTTFYIAPDYLNPRLEWERLDGCDLYIYVDV